MLQFIPLSFQIASVIPPSVVVPQQKRHFNYQEIYSELSSLFVCFSKLGKDQLIFSYFT